MSNYLETDSRPVRRGVEGVGVGERGRGGGGGGGGRDDRTP